MIETFVVSFTTFFATISPLDVVAIFAVLTATTTSQHRRSIAIRGTFISTVILICFAFLGELVLSFLGISLPALRIAGGILLLLIGIEMVFARSSGGTSTTEEEEDEAASKNDISVFPIATPLIAGPGTMSAVILLMAGTNGEILSKVMVISALLTVLVLTLCLLLLAGQVQKILGVTGMNVISRVFGFVLSALAVQFIIDGIVKSGLIGTK